MALTDTAIRLAKAEASDRKLADSKRLYLLVTATGSKLWRLKYWIAGKEKTLALGSYPEVGQKEARARRDGARQSAQAGSDRSIAKREARLASRSAAATIFAGIADEYIAKFEAKGKAAVTAPSAFAKLLRSIETYSGQPVTKLALRFTPHVYQRPGEVRKAESSEIDFDTALWTIPAERMKQRQPHRASLSQQALAIFARSGGVERGRALHFPEIGIAAQVNVRTCRQRGLAANGLWSRRNDGARFFFARVDWELRRLTHDRKCPLSTLVRTNGVRPLATIGRSSERNRPPAQEIRPIVKTGSRC